ncbi:unnamed protein product [Ixodes persulcatus]
MGFIKRAIFNLSLRNPLRYPELYRQGHRRAGAVDAFS